MSTFVYLSLPIPNLSWREQGLALIDCLVDVLSAIRTLRPDSGVAALFLCWMAPAAASMSPIASITIPRVRIKYRGPGISAVVARDCVGASHFACVAIQRPHKCEDAVVSGDFEPYRLAQDEPARRKRCRPDIPR